MNDSLFLSGVAEAASTLAPLPEPTLARWQPLRIGLIELFHYDSEEFWFRDGHLLLRGNNGTGKSKVLSLTLPFLFDASLKPSRIEPDGDAGKKMAWNLLLGKHERRVGYAWIELGRVGEDGQPRYLTLGAGLAATATRTQVDSWFFITEEQRMGRELWLINRQRAVLGRDRLALALNGHGQVFETATAYRRAVDERLFHLGETRYAALMDTLIQLRQPQLSKKPNEDNLSHALTEALPPLPDDLLGDVAEAMHQLEEHQEQLAELAELAKAIGQFNRRYQQYARVNARRQARVVRSAQTSFDNASRELNEARGALEVAVHEETRLSAELAAADTRYARDRAALDEMQADPLMRDANRLEELERHLSARGADLRGAQAALARAQERCGREAAALAACRQRSEAACAALEHARRQADDAAELVGLAKRGACQAVTNACADPQRLAALDEAAYGQLRQGLREAVRQRRAELALIQERLQATEEAARVRAGAQGDRDMRVDDLDDAAAALAGAEQRLLDSAQTLQTAWQDYAGGLRELVLADQEAVLGALADWVSTLEGENPALAALALARHGNTMRLAQRQAELEQQRGTLHEQGAALAAERQRLIEGEDKAPPVPYQRSASARTAARPGAPFWQLLEFRGDRAWGARQRVGLEAALETAGLLDAWVSPDGTVQVDADEGRFDTLLQWRAPQAHSLADWLEPAQECRVERAQVLRLLQAIACGEHDDGQAEAWVAPDGRFRLGPLAGRWDKPAADYIGAASRAEARRRRLAEIEAALAACAQQQAQLEAALDQLARRRAAATCEWERAPADDAVRRGHIEVATLAQQRQQAALRLAQADQRLAAADGQWRQAGERLRQDAADLALPFVVGDLSRLSGVLTELEQSWQELLLRAGQVRQVLPEQARQAARTEELEQDVALRDEHLMQCRAAADEAAARLDALRGQVGVQIEELKARLAALRQAVQDDERSVKAHGEQLRRAAEQRARGEQRMEDAQLVLQERVAARQQAIHGLEQFYATGLLAVALPELDAGALPWTIEAALGVARRAEQALHAVDAEDADWSRVQSAISHDYSTLLRALTALGHQAQAETSDYGMIVTIVYQNRPQRPDLIEASINEEIAQRRELLTARETEVLENHLQAEVAATVQRMLREAEARLVAINAELTKRPTSTGVKFRLVWQPLPEGPDGAPVGLEEARKRLLNTSFDAWSPHDRQVVGGMLQNRIVAERMRDEGAGGSLLELLARALDYRRWHRFRVQRWQDGQWRPLSGPASSGERALGLTVPLFAAVSSFYTHGGSRHAPRLVLLDEAFAGIDDAARAHCMALVREFDLDFVMTSEREWACYAELPGVSICQLQRHEGIDAVYVSRWSWDGRARRLLPEAARRFPPALDVAEG
jgi:uncharacterized protein (TIGR02680 family)